MKSVYWSKNYKISKDKFHECLTSLSKKGMNVEHEELSINQNDTNGNPLYIDVAWIGNKDAKNLYMSTSGIHGVEGFAGSAIQLSALNKINDLPSDTALAFIHILNPWGMSWLRRDNETNVDLNRNFLPKNENYSGSHSHYSKLDPLINVKRVVSKNDLFRIKLLIHSIFYGRTKTKQAYAEGQYEFPKGLHFGGHQLEKGPAVFIDWLNRKISNIKKCVWVDLHTGLGAPGEDSLLVDLCPSSKKYSQLKKEIFGNRILSLDPKAGIAYKIRGGMQKGIELLFPDINWTSITQEFGTLKGLSVISALRAENSWTHYGNYNNNNALEHWSKKKLLEAFRPIDQKWEKRIIERGITFFNHSYEYLLNN